MEKSVNEFHFPVLIYDNYCTSCFKFAKIIYQLSKRNIEILGHFDIDRSKKLKELVFENYSKDPTKMFWLVKKDKAFASRQGLSEVIKELIKINLGLIKYKQIDLVDQKLSDACYIKNSFYSQYGCGDNAKSIVKRILYLIQNSDSIQWNKHR